MKTSYRGVRRAFHPKCAVIVSDNYPVETRQCNLASIPAELKEGKRWCLWRYEHRPGSKKPTKRPIQPNGSPASVTGRSTWHGFDEVITAFNSGGWDGIGRFFAFEDGLTGIDIDVPANDDEVAVRQKVWDAFDSYTELSPSGSGVHIIVKGSVPTGKRRGNIEVYSDSRYFTFTGNVVRNAPIIDCQTRLDILWTEMGGKAFDYADTVDGPELRNDDDIILTAINAKNGEKFKRLLAGDLSEHGHDWSRADQAFVNMLAFYTDNKAQVARVWLNCALGQRDKAQSRPDYVRQTINKAFDQKLPLVDIGWLKDELAMLATTPKAMGESPSNSVSDLLPIVVAAKLHGKPVPARLWHVADIIPARNVTMISGDGGTGKSLIALQLAVSTPLGLPWMGCEVAAGKALFLTAEDEIDEVHRRLASICRHNNIGLDRCTGLDITSLAGLDALMAAMIGRTGTLVPTGLYEAVARYIADQRPALVVLDTLADLFGGEENNRAHARQFVGLLRRLALEFSTTILLLNHPSLSGMDKGSGTSGSTAWNNSVRSRLYLTRNPENPDMRLLELKKSNYAGIGKQIRIQWIDGAFSAVGHTSQTAAERQAYDTVVDTQFLKLMTDFAARGQSLSRVQQSINYAPKLFANHPEAGGTKKQGFVQAMDRLISSGRIRDTKSDGPPSKQKDIIVLTDLPTGVPTPLRSPFQRGSDTPANFPVNSCEHPFQHPAAKSPIPPIGVSAPLEGHAAQPVGTDAEIVDHG